MMKSGWQTKSLGDVCKTGSGGTPLKSKKEFYENGTIPWLMSGEVSQGEVHFATRFITQKGLENSSARIFPKNTVLVAMYGATAGQVGILKFEASTNQAVCGILPNEQFIPEFLYYLFLSKKDELILQATGNAQPNISQIKIKNTHVPIIKLGEQQRIVTILDEAFAGVATATANAEKNLANARELFENTKREVFENLESVEIKVPLASVCNEMFAGGDAPKDNLSNIKTEKFNIPIIANAVKNSGLYGFTDLTRVNEPSITIAARGSGTGHTEIRYEPFFPIVRLIVLTPNTSLTTLEFLKLAIQNLVILSNGSAIPQLTIPMIKEYSIPLPSISKQQTIVQKLDALSTETKKLEAIYQQKLVALAELKKSILNQAFSGQLQ
ncbi:MAG: restriction endonuclease subunit S [Betaproteobacteria bacterium]